MFKTVYAGHIVRYSLLFPGTRYCFTPFLATADGEDFDVSATPELIEKARTLLPEDSRDSYVEYRVLIELTARELLRYDCCIFHSASFVWQDKAFLLTAPSGTGKTTQYLNWQRLFPDEITMISGDMPVLERREDGSVWAHPTTWNGKEDIGNRICAPVAGIVLLEQGKKNRITPLLPRDSVIPFFDQFIVRPETEEQIRSLARLMDQMLRNVPCFRMVNLGDDASTILLRETLAGCLPKESGGEDGEV